MVHTTAPINDLATRTMYTKDGIPVQVPINVKPSFTPTLLDKIRLGLREKILADYNNGQGSKGDYIRGSEGRFSAYGANPFGHTSGQHVLNKHLPWDETLGDEAGLIWCSQPGAQKMDLYC